MKKKHPSRFILRGAPSDLVQFGRQLREQCRNEIVILFEKMAHLHPGA